MAEKGEGCVKPSKGPIAVEAVATELTSIPVKEAPKMQARVGQPAPDFELAALVGNGFKNIRLSDYKGKWIVICFYPGDFTFV